MIVDENLDRLFRARTHHARIIIGAADQATGSRLGGAPPAPLAAAPPRCPICAGPLWYVLTLAADTLGEAITLRSAREQSATIAGARAVSLLACRDAACRHKSHVAASPSSLVALVHEDAPRATHASELDSQTEGRALELGAIGEDALNEGRPSTDASKVGGRPGYIQGWGEEQEEKAGGFLFQWSDEGFPPGMKVGPSPFLFGVAYVFSRIDPTTNLPVLEDTRAFWQNT